MSSCYFPYTDCIHAWRQTSPPLQLNKVGTQFDNNHCPLSLTNRAKPTSMLQLMHNNCCTVKTFWVKRVWHKKTTLTVTEAFWTEEVAYLTVRASTYRYTPTKDMLDMDRTASFYETVCRYVRKQYRQIHNISVSVLTVKITPATW